METDKSILSLEGHALVRQAVDAQDHLVMFFEVLDSVDSMPEYAKESLLDSAHRLLDIVKDEIDIDAEGNVVHLNFPDKSPWRGMEDAPYDIQIYVQDVNDHICVAVQDPDDNFFYDPDDNVVVPVFWKHYVPFGKPPAPKPMSED